MKLTSTQPPLFIVGCPRSGTTLLAQLLAHTPWHQAEETHFIVKYQRRLAEFEPLQEVTNRLMLIREIFAERPVQGWHLDVDLASLAEKLPPDYSAIVDGICLQRTQTMPGSAWADKTPDYILHLEQIHQLFPTSKFIHVVRDGRDVAVSLFDKPWGPSNIVTAAEYWCRCNQSTDLQAQLRKENLYISVRYEDLLQDSANILGVLFDFLGLDQNPATIESICRPIRRDNTGHWRTILKPRQVRLFEQVAADLLVQHGYETTERQQTVSPLLRGAYKLHQHLSTAWQLFYINIIEGARIKLLGKDPFGD